MGDHDDALAEVVDAVAQEIEQVVAGLRVKGAGGLVGDDDVRTGHQGTGDGNALLLAARQLRRLVAKTLGETEHPGDVVEPLLVDLAVGQSQRQHDVVGGRQRRHEVEGLEHESDVVATQPGEGVVVEVSDLGVADPDPSGGGGVQTRHAVQQGRLARARRSHDGGEAPGRDVEGHGAQRPHKGGSRAVGLGEVKGADRAGGGR